MEKFIHQQNIEHFKRLLLKTTLSAVERAKIEQLLVEEEASDRTTNEDKAIGRLQGS